MSLWQVDDRSTREWMKALYEARLERGLDAAECVREASLHVLNERRRKGLSEHVIDVRNFGLMGAIEMAPRDGLPGARGAEAHKRCFWDENLVVRAGMDTLQFSPFLNSDPGEMSRSFEAVRRVMDTLE